MTRVSRILLKLVVALIMIGVMLGASAVVCTVAYVAILGIDEDPPDDSDLLVTREDVPEDENAFTFFQQAAQNLYWPADLGEPLYGLANDDSWDEQLAHDVLDRNRGTFALLEQGLKRDRCQFPDALEQRPPMKPWLRLSRLMAIRANASFREGQHKQALEEACQVVRFGHLMDNGRGPLIASLLGMGARVFGAARIRKHLARADLTSEELHQVSRELAARRDDGKGLAGSLRIDYMGLSHVIDQTLRPFVEKRGLGIHTLLKPCLWLGWRFMYRPNQTKRMLADFYRAEVQNATSPYSRFSRPIPLAEPRTNEDDPAWWFAAKFNATGNGVGKMMFVSAQLAIAPQTDSACKDRIAVSATQTLIALKAYRVKTGRLPHTLQELVPDFLDELLLDSMDGEPLRYSARKKILYSVGTDLADDGGSKDKDIVFEIDF
ncbi:MAG: hypothetical protein NTX87_07290 [Planctomycetota bacterium]|nr:hypothetical protein [Planctomycetota bacterium]